MKRIFLLFSAVVVAFLTGVAVFLWSGQSPSSIAEKGRKIEQGIQQMQQQGREGVQQAKDIIKQLPVPNTQPGSQPLLQPVKKPEEPARTSPQPQAQPQPQPKSQPTTPTAQTPRIAPKPPPHTSTPPGPPMEDVTHKDKEKLKDLLGQ